VSEPGVMEPFRARFERLSGEVAIGATRSAEQRDRLRSEIVDLVRDTETAIAGLTAFRDELRDLVSRFKEIPRPTPLARRDHLGSTTFIDRGWTQIASGEYAAAATTLRRALVLAPGEPAAELLLGWALMRDGGYVESLALLRHVLEREPDNELAHASIGYVHMKRGHLDDAEAHLVRAIQAGTDRKATLYANFYMGLLYLERRLFGEAKSYFASALELGPNLTEAWWELGRACYLDGSAADAARAWRHGAEGGRYNVWGERCARALQGIESGAAPSFA
jgi:tetratricopeptide (TPR) repeat protein